MGVVWAWVGAPTDSGAVISAEVENGPQASLLVADNASMTDPVEFPPVTVDADKVVKLPAGGLAPDTQYWWQIADNGTVDTNLTGRFRTLPTPGTQASFEIVAASCAGAGGDFPGVLGDELVPDRVSNAEVFDTIRNRNPLMFVHLGDRGYYDLGSGLHGIIGGGSVANYQKLYVDNSRQPRQLALQTQVPTQYVYDDHDWGPNDSDGTIPGRGNHLQVYRQMVPHYPLAGADTPVDQYWQIGRVGFILSDLRADADPNNAPDGPGKSMMGAAQKARLEAFLRTTPAAALVWLMPRQWMGVSSDSWAAFSRERDELVALFEQHGWLDRMVLVYGDRHALGLDTGGNNTWGGFPVLQAAALDTSFPSSPVNRFDTGPDRPGRNQYGTITVADKGDSIDITLAGWIGSSLWRSHTHTVEVAGPAPSPGPRPRVAVAQVRTRVTWLGCDVVSGRKIAELPDVTASVERVLNSYSSADLVLPQPTGGPGHIPPALLDRATQPIRSMIVLVVNEVPSWAGWVRNRVRGTDAQMHLPCVTLEGYLRERRVRDHIFVQRDVASIAAALAGDAGDITGVGSGIGLIVDAPATGVLRDRTYLVSDRMTVYDALRELADSGLIEWTIDLDWEDSRQQVVTKILRVRPRIGQASDQPKARFATRSASETTYRLSEDHTSGRYGNYLVAYAPGEGEDQPASAPAIDQAALDAGMPIVELHWQPSTAIVETATLDEHAQRRLAEVRRGAMVWELSARWDQYPRLNVDWAIGDDIGWDLVGHGHPDGVQGVGRAIGWTLDTQRGLVRPILLDPQSDPEAEAEEL